MELRVVRMRTANAGGSQSKEAAVDLMERCYSTAKKPRGAVVTME